MRAALLPWVAAGDAMLHPCRDRESAARLVDSYEPVDPRQEVVKERVLAFLTEHPDGLERSCRVGHVTASALVVDATGERVLLHLHRKIGMWLQMGGHLDGDANLVGSALREAREESGVEHLQIRPVPVNIDVHPFVAPGEPLHLHLDVQFVARAPADAVTRISAESRDLRWFGWQDAEELPIDDGLRRLIAAARAGVVPVAG